MILATHGIIASSGGVIVPPLLDDYPNSAAAYSLRKLRSAYTGSAIRVRRTNLDEMDIGFTSTGALDTAALLAFTGTGALNNGFVTTWYDQSGNGNNATQSIALNQPQIVNGGSIILNNNKPSLLFDGSDFLDTSSFSASRTLASIFLTFNVNTSLASNMTIFSRWDNRNFLVRAYNNTGTIDFEVLASNSVSNKIISGNIINTNNTYLSSLLYNGSESFTNETSLYVNNVMQSVTRSGSSVDQLQSSSNKCIIASLGSNGQYFRGNISEIIYYDNSKLLDLSNINSNINSFYSIY
jgi:hypothetical protein